MVQFNDIKSQLDLATKNAAGYRAEATTMNKDNLELKVQLDKKIHMLCGKEVELRDLKVKNEELSDLHNVLIEKNDQLTALMGTLSTRHSKSLERYPSYEPPPRYESYTPSQPLRSFVGQPYEPTFGTYHNESYYENLYREPILEYTRTDNYYEDRQPRFIAKLPPYFHISHQKPIESLYMNRDKPSLWKDEQKDPKTVDHPSNKSIPVITPYERK
jgi:hypothetical protein